MLRVASGCACRLHGARAVRRIQQQPTRFVIAEERHGESKAPDAPSYQTNVLISRAAPWRPLPAVPHSSGTATSHS
jgi:hypothetical protein